MSEGEQEAAKEQKKTNSPKYLAIAGIIIILIIIVFAYRSLSKQKTETMTPPVKKTAALPSAAKQSISKFKNGTYSAEGNYITHVGQKHIAVTVTLKNDIITDADVKNEADDAMSVRYQDSFISGFKQFVIGKDISSVHLSKVAKSSLTPNGFNSALQLIESQAKS